MKLRCFIAIGIPAQLQKTIGECIEILKKHDADIKWVAPENLHLTLKFLGNTDEDLLPKIRESLLALIASYKPFYIKICGTGAFPNKKNPRVLWAGLQNTDGMKNLQDEIERSMALLGFKSEEREFNPHLTLGRVRSRRGMIMLIRELDTFEEKEFGIVPVDHILLMKSALTPKGPEYTCIDTIPFGSETFS
jgi:2'-5' RNA ligase